MKSIYYPLAYLSKVKRVNQNYIVNSILLDDFPMLVIAFSWLSPFPLLNAIGIFCLVFSFWCIYEYGYYENDLVAEKYEAKPVLSSNYYKRLVTIKWWQPWIWSLAIGMVGASLIAASNTITITDKFNFSFNYSQSIALSLRNCYKWFGFLVASRICFFIYNYVNKQTRIWLYPLLHGSRYYGLVVLTASNWIGISILMSHILARSTSYFVYRYTAHSSNGWPKLQDWFLRLMFFIFFIGILSFAESDWSLIINWQAIILVLWWFKKCRRQFMEIVRNIKPVWAEKEQEENKVETYNLK